MLGLIKAQVSQECSKTQRDYSHPRLQRSHQSNVDALAFPKQVMRDVFLWNEQRILFSILSGLINS